MRIAVATLGCKVNQSESSSIEGTLINENHEIVNYDENPDIFIINTCSVTAKSDYQSRQLIRKAIKTGAKVIATGCYAQLKPDELLKIKGLGLIIGNSEKKDIASHIEKLKNKGNGEPSAIINAPSAPLAVQPYHSMRSRAFLKIQDGCNSSCSYCAIPLARGRNNSLDQKDVLRTVEKMSNDGYREIVLTGIHIGFYGLDLNPKSSLLNVVEMLIESFPHIRFRLSSIEPHEFKDEFLLYIKKGNLCAHLHIPLQSGSDKILKAMNRGYTTDYYKKVIDKIISSCPDVTIGTDIITGFPGESEDDFIDTVKFIEQLPLGYLHVFSYSRRPNTAAFSFNNHVDEKTKQTRAKVLIEIAMKKSYINLNSNLGKLLDVIVERKCSTEGLYKGISSNYLKLLIKSDNLTKGHRLKARVISLTDSELIAKPIN
jgi:threonylcarbamoyladenosine tRNA methylthiotransferase MtaB